MTRPRTIRAKVEEDLRRGLTPEQAWRAAEEAFPHNCIGWGYVNKIKRDLDRAEAREDAP